MRRYIVVSFVTGALVGMVPLVFPPGLGPDESDRHQRPHHSA